MAIRTREGAIASGALIFCAGLMPIGAARAAVVISSAQTQNMNCSEGVCAPTAGDAVLNDSDLENLLASGNVKVTTTGSGVQADDVIVAAPLAWTNTNTLALDAYQSITINKTLSVQGQGGLSLTTNDGGSGGALSFGRKGHAVFTNLSSRLTIEGTAYTLVDSVKSLAGAVAANPGGAFAFANKYNARVDGIYSEAPVQAGFTGTFEGLGNAITHLSINGSGYIGLFAVADGTVENLDLLDVDIIVHGGSQAGSLAGVAKNVSHVRVTGIISGEGESGNDIGGIAGPAGTITYSSADVRITEDRASAVSGLASGGDIYESFATGSLSATGDSSVVGGLVSGNDGDIRDSYATGAVTGGAHSKVGGLVGMNGESKESPGTIETSYSTGAVSGGKHSKAGGFAGIAYHGSSVEQSYWDTTTSGTYRATGKGSSSGIGGLSTRQFQSGLPSGFDPTIWAENKKINNGLPYLIANPPAK